MEIRISICPTSLDQCADLMDGDKYLARIREVVTDEYPDADIECLQIGHRQGDEWYQIDGEKSEELYDLVHTIDCSDENLYPTMEDLFPDDSEDFSATDLVVWDNSLTNQSWGDFKPFVEIERAARKSAVMLCREWESRDNDVNDAPYLPIGEWLKQASDDEVAALYAAETDEPIRAIIAPFVSGESAHA